VCFLQVEELHRDLYLVYSYSNYPLLVFTPLVYTVIPESLQSKYQLIEECCKVSADLESSTKLQIVATTLAIASGSQFIVTTVVPAVRLSITLIYKYLSQ